MISFVVILDMVNTIGRAGTRLSNYNDPKVKPIIALTVMSVLCLILLITIVIVYSIKIINTCKDKSWSGCDLITILEVLVVFWSSVAVCFYFFGDNFSYTMDRYGGCLPGCENNCITYSFYASKILSGAVVVIYAIMKPIQELIKEKKGKSKNDEGKSKNDEGKSKNDDEYLDFTPIIAIIAQMDLLYTIATSNLTGTSEVFVNIILLAVAIAIGSSLLLIKAGKQCQQNKNYIVIVIMNILIWLALIIHTLGDNLEPLDSISSNIRCTTQNVDSLMNCLDEKSCRKNSIIRLVLASVSLVFVIIPTLWSLCCKCKSISKC